MWTTCPRLLRSFASSRICTHDLLTCWSHALPVAPPRIFIVYCIYLTKNTSMLTSATWRLSGGGGVLHCAGKSCQRNPSKYWSANFIKLFCDRSSWKNLWGFSEHSPAAPRDNCPLCHPSVVPQALSQAVGLHLPYHHSSRFLSCSSTTKAQKFWRWLTVTKNRQEFSTVPKAFKVKISYLSETFSFSPGWLQTPSNPCFPLW